MANVYSSPLLSVTLNSGDTQSFTVDDGFVYVVRDILALFLGTASDTTTLVVGIPPQGAGVFFKIPNLWTGHRHWQGHWVLNPRTSVDAHFDAGPSFATCGLTISGYRLTLP